MTQLLKQAVDRLSQRPEAEQNREARVILARLNCLTSETEPSLLALVGAGFGVYGRSVEEIDAYVRSERNAWNDDRPRD